jgi:hypothetical protein
MPLSTILRPLGLPIDVAEARNHVRQDAGVDDAKIVALIRAMTTFAESECRRSILARRWTLTLDSFPGQMGQSAIPWGKPYGLPGHDIRLEYGPVLGVQSIKYLDMARTQQTMLTTDYTVEATLGSAVTAQIARITPQFGKIWPIPMPEVNAVQVTYDAGDAAVVTASGNVLTIKGGVWRPLNVGDEVQLSNSGGALPAPLDPDARYYVQSLPTSMSFTVSATSGGAAITLTDAGTGTHYIGEVDAGLREWLLLRLGSGYDLRADINLVSRGKLEPLPYVDTLLDPYRMDLA